MDIDEDGRLDILLQRTVPDSEDQQQIIVVYNNFVTDAFFIKALMVNRKYGDVAVGTTYRFVSTDLDDEKSVILGSQLF